MISNKCPKQFGKRPHRRLFIPRGGECICRVRWAGTFARSGRRIMRIALMRRYVAMGRHMSPSKVLLPMKHLDLTPSNTWFFGLTRLSCLPTH